MNISPLDLAIISVFGVIFLANFFAFRASRKIFSEYRQLGHDEQIEYRRAAAPRIFNWASTFAFPTWCFGALAGISFAIALFTVI